MHALKYFFSEAAASLWRRWRAALISVLTITAGLFVLGFFLMANSNLQRLTGRWAESAELTVYFSDDATPDQVKAVEQAVARSGLAAQREYVSKERALARFRADFPDLAGIAQYLDRNPLPASYDVRLIPAAGDAGASVDALAGVLGGMAGVGDVRYDRRWLIRLNLAIRFIRGIGLVVIAMLAMASALTVSNVVRLAAAARREEIEIMQLVGAPLAYVRGPFVVEGILQGGAGAVLAVGLLWTLFVAGRARFASAASDALGFGPLTFLPTELVILLVIGGMLLGCIGGFIVARTVR